MQWLYIEENPECTDYELSDYWFKKCGERPKTAIPKNCRHVGMGKPFDREGWDKMATAANGPGAWLINHMSQVIRQLIDTHFSPMVQRKYCCSNWNREK